MEIYITAIVWALIKTLVVCGGVAIYEDLNIRIVVVSKKMKNSRCSRRMENNRPLDRKENRNVLRENRKQLGSQIRKIFYHFYRGQIFSK